jgi:hypothetical protein
VVRREADLRKDPLNLIRTIAPALSCESKSGGGQACVGKRFITAKRRIDSTAKSLPYEAIFYFQKRTQDYGNAIAECKVRQDNQ